MNPTRLIADCKAGKRKAQKQLYERYAPKMFGVCRRYINAEMIAEDVLIEAFYKAFSKLDSFKGEGSFEGWLRRIVINECLMYIRKNNKNTSLFITLDDDQKPDLPAPNRADAQLHEEDILKLLDDLPDGYRTVFNLYAIEGFTHKDIATLLNISINTSKSQLRKARLMLQKLLAEKYDYYHSSLNNQPTPTYTPNEK